MDLGAFAMEMFQAPCQGIIIIMLNFNIKFTSSAYLVTDFKAILGSSKHIEEQLSIMSKEASLCL